MGAVVGELHGRSLRRPSFAVVGAPGRLEAQATGQWISLPCPLVGNLSTVEFDRSCQMHSGACGLPDVVSSGVHTRDP